MSKDLQAPPTTSGGKHRSHKVKQEHRIISALLPVLQQIGECPEVSAVIPARIKVGHGSAELMLRMATVTESGIKVNAISRSSVQEVFITTPDRDAVLEYLRTLSCWREKR